MKILITILMLMIASKTVAQDKEFDLSKYYGNEPVMTVEEDADKAFGKKAVEDLKLSSGCYIAAYAAGLKHEADHFLKRAGLNSEPSIFLNIAMKAAGNMQGQITMYAQLKKLPVKEVSRIFYFKHCVISK
ncbi:MAG: hypothetical protein JKX78_15125 [Alteromonadaceae bacterium]|nr:hypothetical protein [Alteromonadaceae bacterium]